LVSNIRGGTYKLGLSESIIDKMSETCSTIGKKLIKAGKPAGNKPYG
jgi:hypothetical protein